MRSGHFTSSHASSSCAQVVCLILRDFSTFPLLAVYLLSYRLVFPPGHQLLLPRCGGQIPSALQLMRTLIPLPSTTLSQEHRSPRQREVEAIGKTWRLYINKADIMKHGLTEGCVGCRSFAGHAPTLPRDGCSRYRIRNVFCFCWVLGERNLPTLLSAARIRARWR